MIDVFSESIAISDIDVATKLVQESRNSFLKIFQNSPACMSMTTLERRFVKINKKFSERFGYTEQEMVGRTSLEVGMLDAEEMARVAVIIKEKGGLQSEVVRCITKDGHHVYTVSSIERVEINGETYLLSSFLDISKLVEQQNIIEEQNREIFESINYARLIQNSMFPTPEEVMEILPKSFLLAKPKNIVSGDFYWIEKQGDKIFIAACDCTGHGVPGALISLIGFKLLSKFISEYRFSNPGEILNEVNKEFKKKNKPVEYNGQELKDGMDIALCAIDLANMKMQYAGAYNPIYMVRQGELKALTVDKIAINLFSECSGEQFTNYEIDIEAGDTFYMFSDGYADQFGGPKGKKFRYKNFKELLLSIQEMTMTEQKNILDTTIEKWKKETEQEQTDDILVLGFKI